MVRVRLRSRKPVVWMRLTTGQTLIRIRRVVDRVRWASTLSRRKSLIGVFTPADWHNHS